MEKEWKNIRIEPHTKINLDKLKVHPRQAYSEVIDGLIEYKRSQK